MSDYVNKYIDEPTSECRVALKDYIRKANDRITEDGMKVERDDGQKVYDATTDSDESVETKTKILERCSALRVLLGETAGVSWG